MTRRLAALVSLLLAALTLAPAPAYAWSEAGHRLIAELSYDELNPRARAEVERLIATDAANPVAGCAINSVGDASVWSDCVRRIPSFRNQSSWHYDNIPVCGAVPARESWCANGNCATVAIERAIRRLQDRRASDRDRLRALARLVHMIGDIHQPLHAADNADRGGNDVRVRFTASGADHRTNLHAVWDDDLFAYALAQPNARAGVEALMRNNRARWSDGDALVWARQSNAIARDIIYERNPAASACTEAPQARVEIDRLHADAAIPVVHSQIAKASLRLSSTLNRIWP